VKGRFGRLLAASALACAAFAPQATGATPVSTPVNGKSAQFADTIGVGIAPFYDDTAYDDKPRLKQLLQELGIRHLRAGIRLGRHPYEYASARDLAASGMKFMWITGRPGSTIDPNSFLQSNSALTSPTMLAGTAEALEGPNEFDAESWRYPDWAERLYRYMRETYPGFKADARFSAMPHYGPSFIDRGKQIEYRQKLAAERLMDAPNAHPYPGGRQPEPRIAQGTHDVAEDFRDPNRKPVISEVGYHTATAYPNSGHYGVSERAQSIYTLRTFLAAFEAKVPRTYIYGFMDLKPEPGLTDPEMHFGLVGVEGDPAQSKSTWTTRPKAAYHSLKELLEITNDGGLTPGPSSFSHAVSGGPATLKKMLLSRSDGSVDVVLWNQVPVYNDPTWDENDPRIPSSITDPIARREYAKYNLASDGGDAYPSDVQVTLDLAQPSSVRTQRPHSEGDFGAPRWGRTFTIEVGADPVFVRISPSRYAAAVKADSPAAYLRLDEASGKPVDSAGLGATTAAWVAAPTYGRPGGVGDGNAAVHVDGSERTTVRLAAPVTTATGATVELWVKPDSTVPNFVEFMHADDSPDHRVKMRTYWPHDGHWWGATYGSRPGASGEMIFRGFDYGRWHHLVLTMVGGESTTYLDGRKVGSTTGGEAFRLSAFTIGGRDGFRGELDEFAVYPRVLTAGQACAHYRAAGGSC
jgi:hypothetical protein